MSSSTTKRTPAAKVAPDLIHNATPGLGWYTDQILFGENWERPQLSKRDRSFLTVSALIAYSFTKQMTGHFNRALNHGISPTEIVELVTHMAFYAGWPCAMSAVTVMQEVFTARGIGPDQVKHSLGTAPPPSSDAPAFEEFTARVIEGDIWARKELAPRDRSLCTIACCIAQGTLGELPAELDRGRRNGLRDADVAEAIAHLAFYVGWPRAKAVKALIQQLRKDQ